MAKNGIASATTTLLQNETQAEKLAPIDIQFENLSYFVKLQAFGKKKQLLKDINGHFYSGELTAILGPSGSGKTTLLNILAGYVNKGVTGAITINGEPQNRTEFRKLTAYIMQDDLIQPHLTLNEEMMIVAKLKLKNDLDLAQKKAVVAEILKVLGLTNCCDTMVENISGGERKRLSIALELVGDPPIIFVDEPTSGLDSVTINVCINVLKTLVNKGRTVICTLNQPSVSVLEHFRQLYFVANGECIYNGTISNILPFLSSAGLECPITYSYSEFIIETAEMNPLVIPTLVQGVNNGKINQRKNILCPSNCDPITTSKTSRPGFFTQFWIILHRMLVQQSRNKVGLYVQLANHLICGGLFCVSFFGIGNNGKLMYSNFYLCWIVSGFFLYTYVMSNVFLFPFEMEIIKREYLNRWYGFNAFYAALSLRTVPIMSILGFGFAVGVYFFTGQPLDVLRFVKFFGICILLGIICEGLGLAVGSIFSTLTGSIIVPGLVSPTILLGVYGIGYARTISDGMKVAIQTSFTRQGIVAMMINLFDNNRPPFDCSDELYCEYKYPMQVLKDFDMLGYSFWMQVLILIGFAVAFRFVAYCAIKYRLTSEEPLKNESYLAQTVLKQ